VACFFVALPVHYGKVSVELIAFPCSMETQSTAFNKFTYRRDDSAVLTFDPHRALLITEVKCDGVMSSGSSKRHVSVDSNRDL